MFSLSCLDCLTDIRQSLATPKLVGKHEDRASSNLSNLLKKMNVSLVDQIKSVMGNLQVSIVSVFDAKVFCFYSLCT